MIISQLHLSTTKRWNIYHKPADKTTGYIFIIQIIFKFVHMTHLETGKYFDSKDTKYWTWLSSGLS